MHVAAAALAAGIAILVFEVLVARQAPRVFYDSSAYLEMAQKPLGLDQLYYPKSPLVPLVYRVLGGDVGAIASFQEQLALVAWLALAVVLVWRLRTPRARIAAAVIGAALLLAPVRLGFCDAVLSESIDDSLMAIAIAAAVVLATGAWRRAALAVLVTTTVLLVFARDTNAVVAIVAAALAVVLWRQWKRPLAVGLAALVVVIACFDLHAANVAPEPTPFSVQQGWPRESTPRGGYSTVDNVFDRVLTDPDARAYFEAHGLPQAAELAALPDRHTIYYDEHYAPARRWIAERALGTFLGYLARHPVDRVVELARDLGVLAGLEVEGFYMPQGWTGFRWQKRAWPLRALRDPLSSEPIVALLALAALFAIVRARREPLARVAIVLVASGLVGSVAAYYGDASEVARHCYGSGQQIVVGLCVALLVLIDGSLSLASRRTG